MTAAVASPSPCGEQAGRAGHPALTLQGVPGTPARASEPHSAGAGEACWAGGLLLEWKQWVPYLHFLVGVRVGKRRTFFPEFHLSSPIVGKAEGEGRSRPGSQETGVLASRQGNCFPSLGLSFLSS